MAKNAAENADRPLSDLPADHPLAIARRTAMREVEAGDWVKFDKPGDGVVGKVVSFNAPTANVKKGSISLELPNGDVVPVGKGGTLGTQLRDDLIGHWIGIYFVAERQKAGQRQPMKVYEVYDFGFECPKHAEQTGWDDE